MQRLLRQHTSQTRSEKHGVPTSNEIESLKIEYEDQISLYQQQVGLGLILFIAQKY